MARQGFRARWRLFRHCGQCALVVRARINLAPRVGDMVEYRIQKLGNHFAGQMMDTTTPITAKCYSAAELRKLPPIERDAILEAAAMAEHDYRHDSELTAFEAFGPKDIYG